MSFKVPDLILESVLRDGLEAVRRDPSIIDDIFAEMTKLSPLMTKKYGDREIRKIREFFTNKEISIVQAFSHVVTNMPCISIQLIEDTEKIALAHLDDFEGDVQTPITDPERLAALVLVSGLEITSYDPRTGTIYVSDDADLDKVFPNHTFVDAEGTEFTITGGIINTPGQKQFNIPAQSEPDVSGQGEIKSSIDFDQHEQRGVVDDERLLLGIHTEERLLTIYLYIVVKYILVSRKKDLILRGFQLGTFSGSDFTRNLDYAGDTVFDRYLTVSGITQNEWKSDKVVPIELVDIEVLVEKDQAGNAQIGRENQTVKVDESEND